MKDCRPVRSRKVLVMVGSAGIDPWLSIENQAQEPLIAKLVGDKLDTIWVQGDPVRSKKLSYRALAAITRLEMSLFYIRIKPVRRFAKLLWARFRWNSIATVALRRIVRAASAEMMPGAPASRLLQALPTQLSLAGIRSLDSFSYCLNNFEFDYLLRLTSTCLPNPEALSRELLRLPASRVYSGKPVQFAGTRFVSGAAILFSRDVVEGVCRNADSYRYNVFEDVAIGKLISDFDLADLREMPRADLTSVEDFARAGSASSNATVFRYKLEEPITTKSDPVIDLMWETMAR